MPDTPLDLKLRSRLPNIGTTVFTTMSALSQSQGAVNLGQGFPDFACDPALVDEVTRAMREGHNQYPPMAGIVGLREGVAAKLQRLHGHAYDPGDEITITAGATQAILTAVLAVVHPGDEVIVLDPCYDSYAPSIALAGGRVVRVALRSSDFRPDFDAIAQAMTPRTRALIVNSPHNPSASVWTSDDWAQLESLLRPTPVLLISDEVYEHMVFDAMPHLSVAGRPGLAERAFLISSFGKTYHVTGWKVGFVAAPHALSAEFRKVHQFNVFTVNTPMQVALARYLVDPRPYESLPAFYQAKRDLFRAGLARTPLRALPCSGTYFQCVDYSALDPSWSTLNDVAFAERLTCEIKVAAIPLSPFYAQGTPGRIVRFCFAKSDETLGLALNRLSRL